MDFYRIPCQIERDFLLILMVFPVTGKTLYSVPKIPCEFPVTPVNICSIISDKSNFDLRVIFSIIVQDEIRLYRDEKND